MGNINKQQLAEIAQKKREKIIKDFYESQKEQFEISAERGYTGFSIRFDTLDEEIKRALRVEEDKLSELITEVDVKLKRTRLVLTDMKYISEVVFSWQ